MMRFMAMLGRMALAGQLLQEFLLVQPVLERLPAINENHRDFVRKLAAEQIIGFHVNFAPLKAASALQFREFFLHDFAQVASLT
jgi:hypothetical protein